MEASLIKQGISVIICCYNSAQRLPETLRHLASQQVPEHILWEVLVVDNASTDDTASVALKEWNKYECHIPLTVVDQPLPGVGYARKKGMDVATYEYLLFCDDDNWLNADYLCMAYNILSADVTVGACAGKCEAIFESQEPYWFQKMQKVYAVGDQYTEMESGYVDMLWSAGMGFRKSAWLKLKQAGFSNILSGGKGNKLLRGEDDELCKALLLAGYKLWYDERLAFKHFMTNQRLTENYLKKLVRTASSSQALLEPYNAVLHGNIRSSVVFYYWLKMAFIYFWSFAKNMHLWLYGRVIGDVSSYIFFERRFLVAVYFLTHANFIAKQTQSVLAFRERVNGI